LTRVQEPVDWTIDAIVHAHAVYLDPVARAIVRGDVLAIRDFGEMDEERAGMVEVLRIRIIWVTSTVAVRTVVEHAIYPFHWLVPLVRDLNSVSSFYGQDIGLLRMRHVISAASLRLREIDVEGRPVPATVQEVGAAGGYPLVVWVGLISDVLERFFPFAVRFDAHKGVVSVS